MKQLLETVLLGTGKKAFDVASLPDDIRDYIEARHTEDAELQFLETAALSYYYQQAGSKPELFSGEWNDQIIEEGESVAPQELLTVFQKMESVDYQWKETMVNVWLDVLIAREFIVTPEIVTNLLQAGQHFNRITRSKITRVIGNRGKWILANFKELDYKTTVINESAWEEGAFPERKILFIHWRNVNPDYAIEKLKSTWSDDSIANKKSFLEIISEKSTVNDLPFLEELYNNEFKYHSKEKKTEKECRRIIAEIFLGHSTTALYQTTTTHLSYYVKKAKIGLLAKVSGKEQVAYSLPAEDDAFWNSQVMEQTYGFEAKNIDIAIFSYPSQYWLSLFIKSISVSFWSMPFDNDRKRMLDYFLNDTSFQMKIQGNTFSILVKSFVSNAMLFNDHDFAKILIKKVDGEDVVALLPVLTKDEYEQFVEKEKYDGDVEVLSKGPFSDGDEWSASFSRKIIEKAYELALRSGATPSLGQVMANHINKSLTNELVRFHEKIKDTNFYQLWNKNIFEPVFLSMEIRSLIDAHKK